MESMAHVVEAMLGRLQVDLAEDEFTHALHGFNLDSWLQSNQHQALRTNLKRLCGLIGVPGNDTGPMVARAAKALAKVYQTAKVRGLPLDNRTAWSWVLHPIWRTRYASTLPWDDNCTQLVEFYLSLKINTTTLERDLGQLLTQLSSHSGPIAGDGGLMASIMEVHSEGPQTENHFFEPADKPGELLKATEFGLLCQRLWIQHFGRRFRCIYRPKTGSRTATVHRPGSVVSRVTGRSKAAAAAATLQNPTSFVPGLTLPLKKSGPSLPGTRWQSASSTQTKESLKKFELHTMRKKQRAWDASLIMFSRFPTHKFGVLGPLGLLHQVSKRCASTVLRANVLMFQLHRSWVGCGSLSSGITQRFTSW